MKHFNEMNLTPVLAKALEQAGFSTPTPIQAQTIPLALTGRDVMGLAQTGTGKTLAFSIPMIAKLLETPNEAAIILAPTRELVQQVAASIKVLAKNISTLKISVLIGGEPIAKQFAQLKYNPNIIVGTPGRVIDHLKRGTLRPGNITMCVLDETDRMFDMGFSIQIEQIVSKLPKQRQNLMFSATFPSEIERLAAKYLNNPERISVSSGIAPVLKLTQEMVKIGESDKYSELLVQLDKREGSVIVFVKTKFGADRLAKNLCKERHVASAIHGDLRQNKRDNVMNAFRVGRCRIMVATDVAARGLDVPHVMHVINYDLPQAPEDYLHRVGRTARAGAEGNALSFVSPQEHSKWFAIQKFLDPSHKDESFSRSDAPKARLRNRRKPGGFAPRNGSGGGFAPRGNSGFAPRRDSDSSERPSSGGFARRGNSGHSERPGSGFARRDSVGSSERSGSGFAPRGNSNYTPRRDGDSTARPNSGFSRSRSNAGSSDRPNSGGFGERAHFGSADKPRSGFTPRSDRPEGERRFSGKPGGFAKKKQGSFKAEGRWQKKPDARFKKAV